MTKNILRVMSFLALLLLALPALGAGPSQAQEGSRTFPETGKTIKGRFLEYWTTHGGLAQQGFPISEEIQEKSDTDGKTYTVQYFERAVFEKHPENKAPNDVLLSLLGTFRYEQQYPNGAPAQQPGAENAVKFNETGKTLGGRFRKYWNEHGGLAQQGYPISDEFQEVSALNGKTYRVQYFQRAVFEYHPENPAPNDVLLSQLGTFRYKAKYAAGSGGTGGAKEVAVDIVDFDFKPMSITVDVGAKVTWTNVGPTIHTTTGKAGQWDSGIMQKGQKFSYTFDKAGTYEYLCTIHPLMKGTVIVK